MLIVRKATLSANVSNLKVCCCVKRTRDGSLRTIEVLHCPGERLKHHISLSFVIKTNRADDGFGMLRFMTKILGSQLGET